MLHAIMEIIMKREAEFYVNYDNYAECLLCHHHCTLNTGQTGKCRGKTYDGSMLLASNYGRIITVSDDPIEKKPLYHYKPGSHIISVAQSGCNLCCPFCQNHDISQNEVHSEFLSPEDMHNLIINRGRNSIAFTYTEPLMFFEYILDFARSFRDTDIVIISNGSINSKPMRMLAPYISAANIDLKSFNKNTYSDKLCGNLDNVLSSIRILHENNVHLEITHLLVPGFNDFENEFRQLVDFTAGLSSKIPLHISRYFPAYKFNATPTPLAEIEKYVNIASEKLEYVYAGNTGKSADTLCKCGNLLISRTFYNIDIEGIDSGKCTNCGKPVDIVM